MLKGTPSIAEEDENPDQEQYEDDRAYFTTDRRTDTSLVKNQHEHLPQIPSATTS